MHNSRYQFFNLSATSNEFDGGDSNDNASQNDSNGGGTQGDPNDDMNGGYGDGSGFADQE